MSKAIIYRVILTLASLFIISNWAMAEDDSAPLPCLHWDIKSGRTVNKQQSARLYLEAVHWVETKFGEQQVRPCITVHVGDPCPTHDGKTCLSPVSGDLYIPNWEDGSPALVAQAAVMTSMLQIVNQEQVRKLAGTLLAEDRKDFYDSMAAK